MAGWNRHFPEGEPCAVTIAEQPLVVFRAKGGTVATLEDRCVHRLAPLSLGRCEGAKYPLHVSRGGIRF